MDVTPDRIAPQVPFEYHYPESGIIAEYIRWASRTTHAPAFFHLGSILPTIAYECARRGYIVGDSGIPIRLLVAMVSGSGSAKSTASSRSRKFTKAFYHLAHQGRPHLDPYVALTGSMPGVLDELTARDVDPNEPTCAIFYQDEFSQTMQLDDAADVLNKLFDGESYVRHLVRLQATGKPSEVRDPRVFGVFCTTPDSLRWATQHQQLHGGLFARILWLRERVTATSPEVHRHEGQRRQVLDYWVQWRQQLDMWDHQRQERKIVLSPEARKVHLAEFEANAHLILEEHPQAAFFTRLHEMAVVISALYALSRFDKLVHVDDMTRAIQLTRRAGEAVGLLQGQLAQSTDYRLAIDIMEWLRGCDPPWQPARTIYRRFKVTRKTLEPALATLLDMGDVVAQTVVATQKGGRPTTVYARADRVNPPDSAPAG